MKKYLMAAGIIVAALLFGFDINTEVSAKTIFGPNIKINDDTGASSQTDPSIATDPAGNIYLVWTDTRNGNADIYFAKSTDGGITFSSNVRVNDDSSSYEQKNPSIAVDSAGNIYVVWEDSRNGNSNIYFSKSTNGGVSFGTNVRVAAIGSWQGNASISVDSAGNNIYVVWGDRRNDPPPPSYVINIDIYFAKSIDGGATFSPSVRVDDTGTSTSSQNGPEIAVDAAGTIYVEWEDTRNGNYDIYFTKSIDGGTTFVTPNVPVNDVLSMDQYGGVLDVDPAGNIYVAWEDKRSGNFDIYFTKSTDGGANFEPSVRVDDSTTGRQQNISLAVGSDGDIYVAWDDDRNGNNDIYFTKSSDGGATFEANVRVDDTGSDNIYQVTPTLDVDLHGNIYVAWRDERAGNYNSDIYFAKGKENNLPTASDLYISPTSPYDDNNLTANYTFRDIDGHCESGSEIRWYKNGSLQSSFNDQKIIPASATSAYEYWFFTVRPNDGYEFGELKTSPSVKILLYRAGTKLRFRTE